MSVRLGPRGPTSSPVAQRQSSAVIRRRPVDRAHPGLPTTSTAARPLTTKEVCHETDRRRRRVLSRSRASDAEASPLRRESSAAIALSAAQKNSSRSSAATIRAHAAPRSRFKRCCLRSGCFRRGQSRPLPALIANRSCGCSSGAEQPAFNRQARVRRPAPAPPDRCGVVERPQTPAFEAGDVGSNPTAAAITPAP